MTEVRRIVVVGGGVTGLTAAFYALRLGREAGIDVKVTLIEGEERLGGKIRTLRRDGFVIERGPDSFLARKQPMIELARDLGIDGELVTLNPDTKKTYILRGGRLHRIPPGLVLGVPTQWKPFAASSLIGWPGKLRALLDRVLPAARSDADESLGGFLRRRLGNQVVDFVAEPLLSGIYAGDADKLSLMATFPQFRAAERKYGSLIAGLAQGAGATREGAAGEEHLPPHARGSAFLSFRRGLSAVVEALQASIAQAGGVVLTGSPVRAVIPRPEGGAVVALAGGDELAADAVVLTTPASSLGSLLPDVPEASVFADMAYASVANVVFGYRRETIGVPLDGAGFVVPRTEGRFITACTWTSSKWLHTAPPEHALIRCYVGRIDDERWMDMDDEALIQAVRKEVAELVGIGAEPDFADVTRLTRSMPQYEVGHPGKVRKLREGLTKNAPGVFAAGAGLEGVGLPDCVRQGRQAANDAFLFSRRL